MSRFGSDPQDFFDGVYRGTPPWDIGGPQPALAALFAAHPPLAPALDLGCGSGDLAIALAQRGVSVLGVDFVEAAIEQARAKASALPPDVAALVEFAVADALQPTQLQRRFGAVVDSGFLHLFDLALFGKFVEELEAVLLPGGCYYLLAFAVEFPVPNVPRAITQEEVRAHFPVERGWCVRELRAAEFLSSVAPPVPATLACVERIP